MKKTIDKIENKIKSIEKIEFEVIEEYKFFIFFFIITFISILLRMKMLRYESDDYNVFLKPWFDILKENGGMKALKMEIGNYGAPYMTILAILTYLPISPLISIKIVSILFDYICIFSLISIVSLLVNENKYKEKIILLVYGIMAILPTLLLNSACWGQADSIYAGFVILSILYLMKKKYKKAYIFLGIAFSFKLQTIFILPLYIFMYISERKFSIINFLIIPVVYLLMCIPAIIFGKSIMDCLSVYVGQAGEYSQFVSMNFPNIYGIFFKNFQEGHHNIYITDDLVSTVGVFGTITIFAIISILVIYKKIKFDKKAIIEFGLWSVMISTFLLPRMHDRYLFLGDILAILYGIINPQKYYIPISIQFISLSTYMYYLFGGEAIDVVYISVFYLIIFLIYTKDMYIKYFYKEEMNR